MIPNAQRPMLHFLLILTVASTVGLQGWSILFNNFAVEVVGLDGAEVGLIQSIREIPGFLALLVVFVLLLVREHRLAAFSILCLGLGVALTGFFPTLGGLILTTLIMSFGFHYFETTNNSLTLQYFTTTTAPLVYGRLRSIAALASIGTAGLIWILGGLLDFRWMYLLLGALVMILACWALCLKPSRPDLPLQNQRMVLRRRYFLYYFLTFMSGARRQIFIAFSLFLLVKVFDYSVRDMTILFIINNLINFLFNPLIGRAIVHFGERRILSVEYCGIICVFLTYAFTTSPLLAGAMYIVDFVLFNFAVAVNTYFQKVADPADIAPSMAVGFTINHIAAVVLPVVGGALWMLDYRIPFIFGAVLGAMNLIAVQFIKTEKIEGAGT
ncbi:MFS transporter [Geoalkalibacter sp.]|uniref:MFS transporter n=1 Tax=Geoalkalibacter sp. TaxID=3041440 RepID=UPI00272E96F9|nr:MFS transporter [Geoalkalibacter sp.]